MTMNRVHQLAFINTNSFIGVLANLFLIYVIITDKRASAVGYRKMIIIIAVYNIIFSSVHSLVELRYLIDNRGFLAFSETFVSYGNAAGSFGIILYAYAFSQSLGLLAVHCLYRYVKITGKFRFLFRKWYWITVICILSSGFSLLYSIICGYAMRPSPQRTNMSREALRRVYNLSIDNMGYVGCIYLIPDENGIERWNKLHIFAGSATMAVAGCFYVICCVTGIKLYRFVRTSSYSEATRSIHLQLLQVLLAQGAAPIFCEFGPVFLTVAGGVTGVVGDWFAMIGPLCISTYGEVDAFLVLFLFKAYRMRCQDIVRRIFHFCYKTPVGNIPEMVSGSIKVVRHSEREASQS